MTKTEIGGDLGEGFSWDTFGIGKGGVLAIAHLKKLYDKITSDQDCHRFYHKLFTKIDHDEAIVDENNLQMAKRHLGHMDDKFSLSRTQREAIHSWISNDSLQNDRGHMRVMAVNGPPGTGKTTFLSGLIASHIVRSVYQKKYPRFILTSFTNKAVTNILDSFSRCAGGIRLIETRKEIGLSIHFPRVSSNYPHLIMNKEGFSGSILEVEEQFKSGEAVEQYIAKAVRELDLNISANISNYEKLDSISSVIYDKLRSECDMITKINAIDDIKGYDIGHRFNAYRLAIRWLECEWIRKRPKKTDISPKELLEWRMMLTPCVVGTVYKLPQVFEDRKTKSYWFESADYLIIDEAGQGSPEVAVPLFGLAKNAIIVGDTEQLQPIWTISPNWDHNIQKKIFASEQSDDAMFSSSGSIMSVAQKVCPIKFGNTRGALLLNHRRCYKEIIELCNALCYSGQGYALETNTNPKESSFYKTFIGENEVKDPVYPIGLIEVCGECTKDKSTRSNVNRKEIEAVVEWVDNNWEALVDSYAKKEDISSAADKRTLIKDVLAILTPYRGQERQIVDALRSKGLYIKDSEIVVGTVHKLQGAEKAVVLFSTVLDGSGKSRPDFMDKHMLNVAVSRAKKSFIVFTNPSLYDIVGDGSPLDIMKKYIDDWTDKHPVHEPINLPYEAIEDGRRIVAENCNLKDLNSVPFEKNQGHIAEKSELVKKIDELENRINELMHISEQKEAEIKRLEHMVSGHAETILSYKSENSRLRTQVEVLERNNSELTEILNSPKKLFQTIVRSIIMHKQ